eukprot:GDKI01025454.1.p1 GENE.GDKI01025454.1~~GDKI01025454.1.p1  ORF type:complete len:527 (-),score=125.12 GDKI01025454.1:95-1597(-)
MQKSFLLSLLLGAICLHSIPFAVCMRDKGVIPTNTADSNGNFAVFLSKFCFDWKHPDDRSWTAPGEVSITLRGFFSPKAGLLSPGETYEKKSVSDLRGKLLLMVYDDEPDHWEKAWPEWDSSTCTQKNSTVSSVRAADLLSHDFTYSNTITIRQHLRPRWWFFTVVACGIEMHEDIHWEIHAVNPRQGWQLEYSIDHLDMLPLYIVWVVVSLACTAAIFVMINARKHEDILTDFPLFKLFLVAFMLNGLAFFLGFLHYAVYASNGLGLSMLEFYANVCNIFGRSSIIMLVMLIAKGWTITYTSVDDTKRLLGMVGIAALIHLILELTAYFTKDQAVVQLPYQTFLGSIALMIEMGMCVWFFRSLHELYHNADDNLRKFFLYFGLSTVAWFSSLPVVALLSGVLEPWVRFRIVTIVETTIRMATLLILMYWLWPSQLAKHGQAYGRADLPESPPQNKAQADGSIELQAGFASPDRPIHEEEEGDARQPAFVRGGGDGYGQL